MLHLHKRNLEKLANAYKSAATSKQWIEWSHKQYANRSRGGLCDDVSRIILAVTVLKLHRAWEVSLGCC
eukprot:2934399-Amphidinium_carterae.3